MPAQCLWDLDHIQSSCQAAQHFPHVVGNSAPSEVAWQSPWHESAPGPTWRAPLPSYALLAPVTWPCPPHRRLSPPKKFDSMVSCPQASTLLEDRSYTIKIYWRHHLAIRHYHPRRVCQGLFFLAFPCKIKSGVDDFEGRCLRHKKQKQQRKKNTATWPSASPVPTAVIVSSKDWPN